jgi:ATP-dependent phosphoenolpyruvate carboxykinase
VSWRGRVAGIGSVVVLTRGAVGVIRGADVCVVLIRQVRFLTELAWQHHFVTNMFIRPNKADIEGFEPDFTIINACKVMHV